MGIEKINLKEGRKMDLFWAFLFFFIAVTWTTIATHKAVVGNKNEKVAAAMVGVMVIATSLVLFYFTSHGAFSEGGAASLKTNTAYTVSNAFTGAVGEVVLELNTTWTNLDKRYFYLVPCPSLRDGCPEKWPSVFQVVEDGKELIVVPLSPVMTGKKD